MKHLVTCLLALSAGLGVSPATAATHQPQIYRLDNGIQATVYTPEYILEHMTVQVNGETLFLVDDVRYHLITSVDDPAIGNRGDGRFHPFGQDAVLAALDQLRLEDAGLRMRVFILPYPRREVPDSSARDDMMLLSPGVRPVSDYAVHFTVVHEVGHLYQYRWMPDHDVYKWDRYSEMRGIDDSSIYHAGARHKNRPHEVFAEDFRFLFGGERSNYSGSIENPNLRLPSDVDGLEEFLRSLPSGGPRVSASMLPKPNPFNPSTEINVEFAADPGARPVSLDVYDAQGHLVRRLHRGPAAGAMLKLPWDGRADNGHPVASGVYFARLEYAGNLSTTKLMLVK